MAWSYLIVSRRDCSTSISLLIFQQTFFCRKPSNHISCDVPFSFCRSVRFAAYNQFIWWNNGELEEGIHKPVQSSVATHILETSLSSCGHTYTDLGIGSEGKGRTEKLVKVEDFFKRVFIWHCPLIFFPSN